MKKYHAFWIEPVGRVNRYEAFDTQEPILKLVKEFNNGQDPNILGYSNVSDLKIVYGELLEFEPATVVETWRIKETPE